MFAYRCNIFILFVILTLWISGTLQSTLSILAPQIICQNVGNDTMVKSDYTVLRILPKTLSDLNFTWSVRWIPLSATTQRLTIMTWKAVRDLEKALNKPQPEPLLYVIKNKNLVNDVAYVLNVTASDSDDAMITKSITINYIKDAKETMRKPSPNYFSVVLLASRSIYADMKFFVEADVKTCSTTIEYNFIWEISSASSNHSVNVSQFLGSTLEIPPYSFQPGFYEVKCQIKTEYDDIIKEEKATIEVFSRALDVFLSIDGLIITKEKPFTIEALVINHDYKNIPIKYEWRCINHQKFCDFIESSNNNIYNFSFGIPNTGEYMITLTATTETQYVITNATIVVIPQNMPVLEIQPINRILNEGNTITLVGKAHEVAPSCTLAWYFAPEESMISTEWHGVQVSETHIVFSLEENFLSELTDFSNETETAQIEVDVTSPGRVRFVAECNCTSNLNCKNVVTYAEVCFQLNERPKVENLMVLPETGTALETLFQIRIRAIDTDEPLQYSLYCVVASNHTLLLGSYSGYDIFETFLPFIDGETVIWIEVCDALGACSQTKKRTLKIQPSSGKTLNQLINYARVYIKNCEDKKLLHVAMSGMISYTNGGQSKLAALFMRSLHELLPDLHPRCSLPQHRYAGILGQLTAAGLDITPLLA